MAGAPRHSPRSLRGVLAEPSLRGRLASWGLAAVSIAAAIVGIWLLWPQHHPPTLTTTLPGGAGAIGEQPRLTAWPGMRVTVTGTSFTPGGTVGFSIAGRDTARAIADQSGDFRAGVAIPARTPAGSRVLTVTDQGSGRVLHGPIIIVMASDTPAVVVQPAEVRSGQPFAVTAGGLPPGASVRIVISQPGTGAAGTSRIWRSIPAGRTSAAGTLARLVAGIDAAGSGLAEVQGADGRSLAVGGFSLRR